MAGLAIHPIIIIIIIVVVNHDDDPSTIASLSGSPGCAKNRSPGHLACQSSKLTQIQHVDTRY